MDKICKNCTNYKCQYRAEKVAANNCIDIENFKGVGENADSEKSNCTIPDVILSLPEREIAINAFLKIQEWQMNYVQLARTTEVYKIAQKALNDLGYRGNEV